MRFDVRLPIGLVFTLIGLIVAARGLIGGPALALAETAGINVDLIWGGVMIAFGAALLALVAFRRGRGAP